MADRRCFDTNKRCKGDVAYHRDHHRWLCKYHGEPFGRELNANRNTDSDNGSRVLSVGTVRRIQA